MPDWTNAADYDFTEKLDRAGWAWEFMRRNDKYQRDYARVERKRARIAGTGHLLSGRHASESAEIDGLGHRLGAKWGQSGSIANPAVDQTPAFLLEFPVEPDGEQVEDFYKEPAPGAPLKQQPEFATLTFDVRRPLGPQIKRARGLLNARRKQVKASKAVTRGVKQWPVYLRLLDADAVDATTRQIIRKIEAYRDLGKGIDGNYQASDRVSDHRKRASVLVADPLSVIL